MKHAVITIASLIGGAIAHMPMMPENDKVVELGDITENSWAVATKISADDVHYYKFNIKSLTDAKRRDNDNFWMGLYVPHGELEKDFTYFVAFYGMPADSSCKRWADGWGRRLGPGEKGHDDNENKTYNYSRNFINDRSAVIVGPESIPDKVNS